MTILKTFFIKECFIAKGILIALFSSSLTTQAIANQQYSYGFSWGGMYAACSAYQFNQMSKSDAKRMVKLFFNLAKEDLNRELLTRLKNNQYKKPFIDGCKDLIID